MIHVIINPTAGGGQPRTLRANIEKALKERGLSYAVFETEFAGHAVQLARQAAQEGADIVACGGDGTVSEVVCGMADGHAALYIVPCGTGNDFVKSFFRLSRDPIQALTQQLDGELVEVDCGRTNVGAFINIAGAGFDVEVLSRLEQFRGCGKGLTPYLLALCAALRHFKPLECEVTLDGEVSKRSLAILAVANGQYFGGGIRIAREAQLDDGLFDVILVRKLPRTLIALLLPFILNGSYARLSICERRRCRKVSVRAKNLVINVDGELHPMEEAHFEILPSKLRMYRPK